MAAADTAVARAGAKFGIAGSYSPSRSNWAPPDYNLVSPAKVQDIYNNALPTSGMTVSLAAFTSVLFFGLKNYDTVNFIEVAYTYTDASATDHANVVRILPGGIHEISSPLKLSANIVITANTAACKVDGIVVGA